MYTERVEQSGAHAGNNSIRAGKDVFWGDREDSQKESTILLVDDEPMILEVSAEILRILGYKVLTAENGEDALNLYNTAQEDIDLVILDMIMPGMSGSEVVNRMREIRSDVKILLISGRKINEETKDVMNAGYNGFIQKPFSINTLSATVREILEIA